MNPRSARRRCPPAQPRRHFLPEQLRPRPEFLAPFHRIVLDVWEARRQDVAAQRTAAERKIVELKRRKDQLAKLNESLVLAEMEQHGQRADELDVEAVLAYAEKVSMNAARMWLESNLEQRQRFHRSCSRKVCTS